MTKERAKELTLITWKRLRDVRKEDSGRFSLDEVKETILQRMLSEDIISSDEFDLAVFNASCFLCLWTEDKSCADAGCPLSAADQMPCLLYFKVFQAWNRYIMSKQEVQEYVEACDNLISAVEAW
jgi:hypothetical protein